jgi:2-dehydro-3-deoxygalactonokinase
MSLRIDVSAPTPDPIPHDAALLALDWGTTRLRAFLMAADGRILATHESPQGLGALAGQGAAAFEAALQTLCADWPLDGLPAIAGGMVGAVGGWREAPYRDCPAALATLADPALAVQVDCARVRGGRLTLLPGLRWLPPAPELPDVMRGEEVQIAGALALQPALEADSWLLLPGTHAKWARVRDGRVLHFSTHMTGELYALLRRQSLLARLMPAEDAAADAADPHGAGWLAGLAQAARARPGDLGHALFGARTLGLSNRLPSAELPGYLSGLLIGQELRCGLQALTADPAPLVLIGEAALCARYADALRQLAPQQPAPLQLGNTAPHGLWHCARRAGWLDG